MAQSPGLRLRLTLTGDRPSTQLLWSSSSLLGYVLYVGYLWCRWNGPFVYHARPIDRNFWYSAVLCSHCCDWIRDGHGKWARLGARVFTTPAGWEVLVLVAIRPFIHPSRPIQLLVYLWPFAYKRIMKKSKIVDAHCVLVMLLKQKSQSLKIKNNQWNSTHDLWLTMKLTLCCPRLKAFGSSGSSFLKYKLHG